MSKESVAIVGARGMVGSVLRERMLAENDFGHVDATYFSTSQAGEPGPNGEPLGDAHDVSALSGFDVVLTTQGSDYTENIHPRLRGGGWDGYWIDAASSLRMNPDAALVLDPVNRDVIDRRIDAGVKDLIGSNCTVSTMLMGLTGLFREGHVESVIDMTYQAASGAGSKHMQELLQQMGRLGTATDEMIKDPATGILEIDRRVNAELASDNFPVQEWGAPLAANVIPWIDRAVDGGRTREEWKATVEANKILDPTAHIAIDGLCVRVGSMRSHAHALAIELKRDIPLDQVEEIIGRAHEWVELVPNEQEATKQNLTSVAASGDLKVHVGRLHKMQKRNHLAAFVVGDQLLWGAAEPLRRALRIVTDK